MTSRRAVPPALLAAILFVAIGGVRETVATHGNHIVYAEGAVGVTHSPSALCDTTNNQLVLIAPDAVTASYDTTDRDSQRVWWTPRIWWVNNETGVLEHEEWAIHGWYWTWARTGDHQGDLIVFPERGYTGGGANVAWSDANNVTMPLNFTLPIGVLPNVAKKFWAEYIFWWEPNVYQPASGWDAGLTTFLEWEFLTTVSECKFP